MYIDNDEWERPVWFMGARRHGQGGALAPPWKVGKKNKKIRIKNFGALRAPNNNINTIATLKL